MFETDSSGLEQLLTEMDTGLTAALPGLAEDLKVQGVSDTQQRLDLMIYSTPERGYERTGKLRESIHGDASADGDGLTVALSGGPGARNKSYSEYNELGTFGSRVSLDRALKDARAADDPLGLPAYPRSSGLESRPFVLPALAEMEDRLEEQLFRVLDVLN